VDDGHINNATCIKSDIERILTFRLRIPTKMNGDSTDREQFNSPGFAGTLI